MIKKIYIHIGMEKTGTTTLQGMFAANREVLESQGVLYSRVLGEVSHINIPAFAINPDIVDDLREHVFSQYNMNSQEFKQHLLQSLRAELDEFSGHTLVVSSEHLHSRLQTVEEINRLKEMFSWTNAEIAIVVYLRRQDRVAVSLLSTELRFGATRLDNIFDDFTYGIPYNYNYKDMIHFYSKVFGKQNIRIVTYEDAVNDIGGLVGSFCRMVGADLTDLVEEPVRNPSLSATAQLFLAYFNRYVPYTIDGKANPQRANIIDLLDAVSTGKGYMPARADAKRFYDAFAAGNEWVRTRFFPDKEKLFDEDFSEYPTEETALQVSNAQLVETFSAIWCLTH